MCLSAMNPLNVNLCLLLKKALSVIIATEQVILKM